MAKKMGMYAKVPNRLLIIFVAYFKKIACILQLSLFLQTVSRITINTIIKITPAKFFNVVWCVLYVKTQMMVARMIMTPKITAA